jgi:hypothetical protein
VSLAVKRLNQITESDRGSWDGRDRDEIERAKREREENEFTVVLDEMEELARKLDYARPYGDDGVKVTSVALAVGEREKVKARFFEY